MPVKTDAVVVVGGGLVGLATAMTLLQRRPDAGVTVLEKEEGVGRHQSTHNSGVLHCGLYYKPGSMKARMAVRGIRLMTEFCRTEGIAHEICGKLVVATNEVERERLGELEQRGQANGLHGVCRLGMEALREIEPHAAGIAALRVPEEGIVDYAGVCRAMVSRIQSAGGRVVTGAQVTKFIPEAGVRHRVVTTAGEFPSELVINCAGLHCDRVARLAGLVPATHIVPFRGEYFKLRAERQFLVRHLIYPVPDPAFPFLGVHFTRLIHGGIEAGPNAVLAWAREGYRKTDINPRDLAEALLFPGLWRFLGRHARMCAGEFLQSLSRDRFCLALQKLVPDIRSDDLEPGGAGVRAQAMTTSGQLVQDFDLLEVPGMMHVLNAPSPAATASLAIAEEILGRLGL